VATVLASLAHVGSEEGGVSLRELAITLFLFITAPVTAHLLSKAALAEARRRTAAEGNGRDRGVSST
jgi:multicomponent K+:H+ antiporter subunit G